MKGRKEDYHRYLLELHNLLEQRGHQVRVAASHNPMEEEGLAGNCLAGILVRNCYHIC